MCRNDKEEKNHQKVTTTTPNTGLSSTVLCLQQSQNTTILRYLGDTQNEHVRLYFHAHTCFRTHKKCRERTDSLISLCLCEDPIEHNSRRSSSFCRRSSFAPPFLHQEESNTVAEILLRSTGIFIFMFLLPTSRVMITWTEHPSAVSKDMGCSSNFSACDSHYREKKELPPSDTSLHRRTPGEEEMSHSEL